MNKFKFIILAFICATSFAQELDTTMIDLD